MSGFRLTWSVRIPEPIPRGIECPAGSQPRPARLSALAQAGCCMLAQTCAQLCTRGMTRPDTGAVFRTCDALKPGGATGANRRDAQCPQQACRTRSVPDFTAGSAARRTPRHMRLSEIIGGAYPHLLRLARLRPAGLRSRYAAPRSCPAARVHGPEFRLLPRGAQVPRLPRVACSRVLNPAGDPRAASQHQRRGAQLRPGRVSRQDRNLPAGCFPRPGARTRCQDCRPAMRRPGPARQRRAGFRGRSVSRAAPRRQVRGP